MSHLGAPEGGAGESWQHRPGLPAFFGPDAARPSAAAVSWPLVAEAGADAPPGRGRATDAQRPIPDRAVTTRRTPTTTSERWEEMIETSHEGFAVLDADHHVVFANERAAATLGFGALTGADLHAVLPELGSDEHDAIDAAIASGTPLRLMVTRRPAEQEIRAVRLTFVPREGRSRGAILLMQDITQLRANQDQRRRSQHRLTEVEDEEQRRIGREIHDGPIQILAALALRLGIATEHGVDPQDVDELEAAVEAAGAELREILGRTVDGGDDSPSTLLRRWAAPILRDAPVDLEVVDRTATPPNRATTEALFVFLHEVIRACARRNRDRTLVATLRDHGRGTLLEVAIPESRADQIDQPAELAQVKAARRYAALLEGWLRIGMRQGDVRVIEAWLPPLDEGGWAAEPDPSMAGDNQWIGAAAAGGRPELSEADREAVMRASHEGLMELDRDLRIVDVNDAYATAMGQPAAKIRGLEFERLFGPEDFARLRPWVERVRSGTPVRFEWQRSNTVGQRRWTQVAGSPRLDSSDHFDGALMTTLDTTDLHVAEDLRDAVLADLDRARRSARLQTSHRLNEGPIQRLEDVDRRLQRLIETGRPDELVRLIQRELQRSIAALHASADDIADPDLSEIPWGDVLRDSLSAHLGEAGSVLVVEGPTNLPLTQGRAESLVRIAREAVINAIRHGAAGRVTVTVLVADEMLELEVRDDGSGFEPADVEPTPGHLGIRSMHERTNELGGMLAIEPGEAGGAVLTVTAPLVVEDKIFVI
ncbi:MAG: PAS domain-containing protein [Ilumatobacteraceae bacterium]